MRSRVCSASHAELAHLQRSIRGCRGACSLGSGAPGMMAQPLHFLPMPGDEELLGRALAYSDEDLLARLDRAIIQQEERLAEGGTEEQIEARTRLLRAAERARERVLRRLGRSR